MEQIGVLKNNAKVILDYAHTPDALENCLVNIKEQFKNEKLILFLDVEEKEINLKDN